MAFIGYTDFKLGDKKLSDFGGILWNGGNEAYTINLLPTMTKKTEQLPNTDGNIYYGATYDPRLITLYIVIDNPSFNETDFTNWIKEKVVRDFYFIGDTKKIKVVCDDMVNLQAYNKNQGTIELKLIAYDPYWYLITDSIFSKTSPVINTTYSFTNSGNDNSFPLIKLQCSGTQNNIIFELNGKQFKIKTMTTDVYIDFYTETVYNFNGSEKMNRLSNFECLNGKYKYEFGELPIGNNTIKITSGTLTNITVNCRSRFI